VLRASGIRYSFVALPVVVMGLLVSVLGFAMNDYFLPLGLLKFNRLRKQIVQSDPAVEIEADTVKRMNGTTIVIGGVNEDGSIENLVMFDRDQSGRDRVIVTGRSDVSKSDEPGIMMKFNMSGATVLELDREQTRNFDVFESQKILLNIFDKAVMPTGGVQPREMTSYDLWKIIQVMKKDESVTHKMMNRYNLEFAKKFSLPFGSIFFALLAFPLSLVFGKWDGQTLGMIFGVIISVIYWAATILGQTFGVRSGWNGFWMMWGPNFFIGLLGLLLYLMLRKR
ncbi:MAG: LptF/LptG family permease, partial [Treponema sp.]|nr:LptF/LptG family permease [Treponema sp.]